MKSWSPFLTIVAAGFFPGCKNYIDKVIKTEGTGKPNIIFILTDDQRWDALGYAGNKIVNTPEIDLLANSGAYFRNAFASAPICAASRASILTGLYERTHGYSFQQGPLKKPYMDISYPVILRKHGYYSGFFGKLGVDYPNAEKLFEHLWNFKPLPSSEGIRTGEWKYFRYRTITAPEELYNLISDPHEKVNLSQNPECKKILERFWKVSDAQALKFKKAKLCPDTVDPKEVKVNFLLNWSILALSIIRSSIVFRINQVS